MARTIAPSRRATSSPSSTSSIKGSRTIASARRVPAGHRREAHASRRSRFTRTPRAARPLTRLPSARQARHAPTFSSPGKPSGASPLDPRPTSPAPAQRWAVTRAVALLKQSRLHSVAVPDTSRKPMRPLLLGLAFLVGPVVVFAACSQDPGSASTSDSSSSSGGTGGAPNCEGVYLVLNDKDGGHPCDICLHDNCCAEIAACRDKACILCANYGTGPGCSPQSKVADDCASDRCLSTCSPGWHPPTSSTSGG